MMNNGTVYDTELLAKDIVEHFFYVSSATITERMF
jgi:hypothetical protein